MGAKEPAEQVVRNIRREHVLDITAGIERHDETSPAIRGSTMAVPHRRGPRRLPTRLPSPRSWTRCTRTPESGSVVRADTLGLFLLETGPWLAWLPLNFLDALAGPKLRPLPLKFGRYRYRAGFIARRSAEDLAPFQQLEETVRDAALERSWQTHR